MNVGAALGEDEALRDPRLRSSTARSPDPRRSRPRTPARDRWGDRRPGDTSPSGSDIEPYHVAVIDEPLPRDALAVREHHGETDGVAPVERADGSSGSRGGPARHAPRPRISKLFEQDAIALRAPAEGAGVLHREQARQIPVVRVEAHARPSATKATVWDGPAPPVHPPGSGCRRRVARRSERRRTGTPSARRVTAASVVVGRLACMRLRGTSTRSRTGSTAWLASDGTPRPTAGRGDVATGSRGAPRAPGRTACPSVVRR